MSNPRRSILRTIAGMLLVSGSATGWAGDDDRSPALDDQYLPDGSVFAWQGRAQLAGFRNMAMTGPARTIHAGSTTLELPRDEVDLSSAAVTDGTVTLSLDEYITSERVAGLLVIQNGTIRYERYTLGNTPETRWVSFSVAKSVVSLLYGAAVQDGYIESLDAPVTDYLPKLKGSSYGSSSVRHLLQMASGVQWNEDYADPQSDVATADYATLALYEHLRDKPRDAKPGEKFNYNTAETNIAGTLLRAAIGNNLSTYLSAKIWQPFGMEHDATWQLTEPHGGEFGGCCINATLRDYGRLGLFALADGALADGTRVLPEGWMRDATTPSPAYSGYGYFWWLGESGTYEASGIYGQGIFVHPERQIVIAIHSARQHASRERDWALQDAMYHSIVEELAVFGDRGSQG